MEYITVAQAAKELGMSTMNIYRLIREKKITAHKNEETEEKAGRYCYAIAQDEKYKNIHTKNEGNNY